MNPVLAHCGKCYEVPGPGTASKFFLTGCRQVYCQKCLATQGACKKCGKNCPHRSVVNSTVAHVFQDPSSKVNQLKQSISFQSTRYNTFSKYLSARQTNLMKAHKERDAKIQRLENQITDQENQISLLKQQQANFQANLPNVDSDMSQDLQSSFVTNAVNNAIGHERNNTVDNFLINIGDNIPQDFFPLDDFGNRPTNKANYESQRHHPSSNFHFYERKPEPRSFLAKHSASNKFRHSRH